MVDHWASYDSNIFKYIPMTPGAWNDTMIPKSIDFQEHHGKTKETNKTKRNPSFFHRRLSASDGNSSPWLKHQWRLMIGAVSKGTTF